MFLIDRKNRKAFINPNITCFRAEQKEKEKEKSSKKVKNKKSCLACLLDCCFCFAKTVSPEPSVSDVGTCEKCLKPKLSDAERQEILKKRELDKSECTEEFLRFKAQQAGMRSGYGIKNQSYKVDYDSPKESNRNDVDQYAENREQSEPQPNYRLPKQNGEQNGGKNGLPPEGVPRSVTIAEQPRKESKKKTETSKEESKDNSTGRLRCTMKCVGKKCTLECCREPDDDETKTEEEEFVEKCMEEKIKKRIQDSDLDRIAKKVKEIESEKKEDENEEDNCLPPKISSEDEPTTQEQKTNEKPTCNSEITCKERGQTNEAQNDLDKSGELSQNSKIRCKEKSQTVKNEFEEPETGGENILNVCKEKPKQNAGGGFENDSNQQCKPGGDDFCKDEIEGEEEGEEETDAKKKPEEDTESAKSEVPSQTVSAKEQKKLSKQEKRASKKRGSKTSQKSAGQEEGEKKEAEVRFAEFEIEFQTYDDLLLKFKKLQQGIENLEITFVCRNCQRKHEHCSKLIKCQMSYLKALKEAGKLNEEFLEEVKRNQEDILEELITKCERKLCNLATTERIIRILESANVSLLDFSDFKSRRSINK